MLNKISSYVEGVVLGCRYSFYCDSKFSVEEIKEIYQIASKKNIKTYILINLVMHQNHVDEVKEFIASFQEEVYFIFQDLGILNILLELNKAQYGIYNPLTMITNYRDVKEYEVFSLDAIGVSSEIPVKDVNKCTSICSNVFYLGFGYHPMYQTYRQLLSLYKEHSGLKFTNDNLFLQEATRENDRCPIVENDYGSVVFRSGVISTLERIEELKDVKYYFLDGIFLDEEVFIKVLETYYQVIRENLILEEGLRTIASLNLSINNQFMDVDSVYNPKEFE
jgi:collagenase-like PrtC family protease